MKKVIIVGSGISGISISRMLKENYDVEIVEADKSPGGIIKCELLDGNLFHRVGGHVFNSKNKKVLDWFWAYFDKDNEFIISPRNAKILLNNKYIGYPIENYLYELPKDTIGKILEEILRIPSASSSVAYSNFEDFLIKNFGTTLYELYFNPYNSKIWNTDLSLIPLPWLDGKLPMPNVKEVLLNNILRNEESSMVHSSFYYPKSNGSQFIVDRLVEGISISYEFDVKSIEVIGSGDIIINSGEKRCKSLIFTGDVRDLHLMVKINDSELVEAMADASQLFANGTSNMLCETDTTDISWLYLPDKETRAHRIIYTGNFSNNNNNNNNNKRISCVVEYSGKVDRDLIIADLRKLPGNLLPLAYNYEPKSYVVQNSSTRKIIDNLKLKLSKYNIFLVGRFAEWEYYNMDKCIESAMFVCENMHV